MFFTTGARKKKGLTDTITILPFPAPSLRKETPRKIIEESVKEPATKLYANKLVNSQAEQLPLKTPSKTISIKQALAEEKERQLKSLEEKARELFSTDQLIMAWKQYAFTMKEIGKDTFFHALTKRGPSFVNIEKITLTVENNIQIEYIRPLLQDFILFLRQTLKNEYIEIELQVTNEEVVKVVPITGQDKFNALANKNANLMILKNTFNLDIDY